MPPHRALRGLRPVEARITVHTPGLAALTRIAGLPLAHITVQPMPGGRFLVAGVLAAGDDRGQDRGYVAGPRAGLPGRCGSPGSA